MQRRIEFSPPDISAMEMEQVAQVLSSGWITTGSKTKAFEAALAQFIGTPRVVCLSSATAALELTLRLLGIGVGDEVITTAYTYTATAAVIVHTGARLVLCDTAEGSFEMDYCKLESLITPQTKAIICVDVGGVICDYSRAVATTEKCKGMFTAAGEIGSAIGRVAVIADAAHSLGAVQDSANSGQIADFSCFSFHAVKNLTTGEGGAVTWRQNEALSDDELYRRFMLMSLHGQTKDALAKTAEGAWEYDVLLCGGKCNMTDIAAAIGTAQLGRYPDMLRKRHKLIEHYGRVLAELPIDIMAHKGEDFVSSGHLMITRLADAGEAQRGCVMGELAKAGIAANVHYKPLPMLTAYKKMGFDIADFPNAYNMYQGEMTLPLHTLMSTDDIDYIGETLRGIIC